MTPEARNVQLLKRAVEEAGGEVRKVHWEGRVGAPDFLVLLPRHHFFVEVKAPSEEPRIVQVREHDRLRDAGCGVYVVDCHAGIKVLVNQEKRKSAKKVKEYEECANSLRVPTKR